MKSLIILVSPVMLRGGGVGTGASKSCQTLSPSLAQVFPLRCWWHSLFDHCWFSSLLFVFFCLIVIVCWDRELLWSGSTLPSFSKRLSYLLKSIVSHAKADTLTQIPLGLEHRNLYFNQVSKAVLTAQCRIHFKFPIRVFPPLRCCDSFCSLWETGRGS